MGFLGTIVKLTNFLMKITYKLYGNKKTEFGNRNISLFLNLWHPYVNMKRKASGKNLIDFNYKGTLQSGFCGTDAN